MTRTSKNLSYQRTKKNFSLASTKETYSRVTANSKVNDKFMRSNLKDRKSNTATSQNTLTFIGTIPRNSMRTSKMKKENLELQNK